MQKALNYEKDNMAILRETAALQIQVRDHNNHVATRLKILQLKPNLIQNWISFALAQHLVIVCLSRKETTNSFLKLLRPYKT